MAARSRLQAAIMAQGLAAAAAAAATEAVEELLPLPAVL